jgi:hypothetical protein
MIVCLMAITIRRDRRRGGCCGRGKKSRMPVAADDTVAGCELEKRMIVANAVEKRIRKAVAASKWGSK